MLSDKIWVTRKTRIYTEERLQWISNISQALMIVYSLALVSISIYNLQSNDPKLNIVSAFASIVVLVLSVHLTAQKYAERSLAMRNCYVKLDELYSKAKRAELGKDEDALPGIESEYTSILVNIENHSEFDYLCLRYSLRDKKDTTLPRFTKADYVQYFYEKTWRAILIFVLFGITIQPIVLIWL
jgi:hypothetical protein